jgi:putative membrane protein
MHKEFARAAALAIASMSAISGVDSPAIAQPYGQWEMMDGWGRWGGWIMPFHGLGLLFWIVVIAAVVWLVRSFRRPNERGERSNASLDVLEQRYAGGEINRDEYLQKKRDMVG